MTNHVFDFLRIDDLPRLSRPNYRREFAHLALWGVVVGTLDGTIAGVVAKKTFGASDALTTIVWSLPIIANVLNLVWGIALQTLRKRPTYLTLAALLLLCVASVALTPSTWQRWGAVIFAAQVGLMNTLLSGLLTLRSTIWRVNYPTSHRARITSRLLTLRWLISLLSGVAATALFDHDPLLYRFLYPATALIGAFSLAPLSFVRIRGERAELIRAVRERRQRSADGRAAWWHSFSDAIAILHRDRPYAVYMLGQFCLGSANFFVDGILISLLSGGLGLGYLHASALITFVPTLVTLLTLAAWSYYLDRHGVIRFRVVNTQIWLSSYVGVTLAYYILQLDFGGSVILAYGVFLLGRLLNGVARGGGTLAWSIGHLDFASGEQAELYLGIHVALTGVRGLIMPLAGTLAYQTIGGHSFLIAILFNLVALRTFSWLVGTTGDVRAPSSAPRRAP